MPSLTPTIPDHTLLRPIGRGSYGTVWLARNVMGVLRAVKIVQREAFETERPFEREFSGIRRCEPLSRAHDGLVDILHIGQAADGSWYYYVMELADAVAGAAGVDEPAEYLPATLSVRLRQQGHLPVAECLHLAESLAGALAFLHERGLVHRDLKPSNVLFVEGVPKLGDIGLVNTVGREHSYVGTEGFVPRSGPGTEHADLYALGKVIYEAMTGLDRTDFPALPPWWKDSEDLAALQELNEIVLRACEPPQPTKSASYQSAREMLADIALISSGRSIKKLHRQERQLRLLARVGWILAAVAVTLSGIAYLAGRQSATERALREKMREERHKAVLAEIHATRHNPEPGCIAAALAKAEVLAQEAPSEALVEEVAFLLGKGEFVPQPALGLPGPYRHASAHADEKLAVTVMEAGVQSVTVTLQPLGGSAPRWQRRVELPEPFQWSSFSADARRVLLACDAGSGVVLETATGAVETLIPKGSALTSALTFCGPRGDALIRRSSSGSVARFELPLGHRSVTPVLDWPISGEMPLPAPDGSRVVLIHARDGITPGRAACFSLPDGVKLWEASGPEEQIAAFSPNGRLVALRSAGHLELYDAQTGFKRQTLEPRLYNAGTRLAFLDEGNVLAFATWSQAGWADLTRKSITPRLPLAPENYGPNTQLLCGGGRSVEVCAWRPSAVLRVLDSAALEKAYVHLTFTPDSQELVVCQEAAFRWHRMDAPDAEPVRVWEMPSAMNVLFPGGRFLECYSQRGIHRAPWPLSEEKMPEVAVERQHSMPQAVDFTASDASGATVAAVLPDGVRVWGADGSFRDLPHDGSSGHPLSLSPDGRWLAVGSQHGSAVLVYNLQAPQASQPQRLLIGSSALGCFSPDGRWLACSGGSAVRIYSVPQWQVVHEMAKADTSLLGHIHFTADARRMIVPRYHNQADLVECGTWRRLLPLRHPDETQLNRTMLSPDGRWFAAVGIRQEILLWDLRRMEQEIAKYRNAPGK